MNGSVFKNILGCRKQHVKQKLKNLSRLGSFRLNDRDPPQAKNRSDNEVCVSLQRRISRNLVPISQVLP